VTFVWLAAPALAIILLAAHFLRAGNRVAIAVCAVMLGLLFVPRRRAARTIQAALVLGAIEWLRLTVGLVLARQATGVPFLRLALILGGVALFTAISALVFESRRCRIRFGLDVDASCAAGPRETFAIKSGRTAK
jgi:hypothetical protein